MIYQTGSAGFYRDGSFHVNEFKGPIIVSDTGAIRGLGRMTLPVSLAILTL